MTEDVEARPSRKNKWANLGYFDDWCWKMRRTYNVDYGRQDLFGLGFLSPTNSLSSIISLHTNSLAQVWPLSLTKEVAHCRDVLETAGRIAVLYAGEPGTQNPASVYYTKPLFTVHFSP
jgi:hypothetical protein